MKKHLSKHVAAAAAAAVALAGAGATVASTSASASVDPAQELYGHLPMRPELPGYIALACSRVEGDARGWTRGPQSGVAQLRANGFTAGVKLHSQHLGANAVESVARFDSAEGAHSQLEGDVNAARLSRQAYAAFAVPGVRGAEGFTVSGGGTTRYTVTFADGRYLYVVSVSFSSNAAYRPAKAQVVDAATALYDSVHERDRVSPLTRKRLLPLR